MIKAIFWDNDGVLVDTERLYFQATQDVFASAGVLLSDDDYLQLFLRQNKGAWHLLEERGASAADIHRLRHQRNNLYRRLLGHEARVIDGVPRVLERCAASTSWASSRARTEITSM